MSERSHRPERRPAHIPSDWRTRQQAQADLGLRSPTALNTWIKRLQPGPEDFQKSGLAGYLSPQLMQRIELALSAVQDIRDLPGYLPATDAAARIGCSYDKFGKLVEEYPPSVHNKEVVRGRNDNSEITPLYAGSYVDRLAEIYQSQSRARQSGTGVPDREQTPRPSAALKETVLRRIERVGEPVLVNPDVAERERLMALIRPLADRLAAIPRGQRDGRAQQLLQQFYMAMTDLSGTKPIPQGVERLIEGAQYYFRKIDED